MQLIGQNASKQEQINKDEQKRTDFLNRLNNDVKNKKKCSFLIQVIQKNNELATYTITITPKLKRPIYFF